MGMRSYHQQTRQSFLGYLLPNFPHFNEHNLSNTLISVREVSRLIKSLDPSKATGPDKIPVVILKNINPELSLILAKLFNYCLKEKSFPSLWKEANVCSVFKKAGE